MKRVDNIEGYKKREYELGFYITDSIVKPYFGQKVPVKKLEEVFGKITENDIENHRSPEIVDHILCCSCEARFSKIEMAYSETLNTEQSNTYTTNIDKNIAFAFWMSIIWRISITENHGVKLSKIKEEKLRNLLNDNLGKELKDLKDMSNYASANSLSYRLIRCVDYSINYGGFVYCQQSTTEPISFAIGEFVLLFNTRKKRGKDKGFSFLGFEKYKSNCSVNNLSLNESVYVITNEDFKICINNFVKYAAKIKTKSIFKQLDYIHINTLEGNGNYMPDFMKKEILIDMIDSNLLARRYNIQAMSNAIYKVVKRNIQLYPLWVID
jgi:hypothetical protein